MPSWPWAQPSQMSVVWYCAGKPPDSSTPYLALLHQPRQVRAAGVAVAEGVLQQDLRLADVLLIPAGAHLQRVKLRPQQPLRRASLFLSHAKASSFRPPSSGWIMGFVFKYSTKSGGGQSLFRLPLPPPRGIFSCCFAPGRNFALFHARLFRVGFQHFSVSAL